jgi:hypothetical protein
MADVFKNFAVSLVATAPSPATSGTSLVVTAAEGALFPAVPFNCTIWPSGTQPTAANAEVVRVTGKSTDTFTITRAQEGSTARTVVVGDQIAQTITAAKLNAPVRYFNKPAGNITRAATTVGAFSTAWQIPSVVVAAGQNVYLHVSAAFTRSNTSNDVLLALFRDSTQIAALNYSGTAPVPNGPFSWAWIDENPGAATYTYEVRAAMFTSGTLTVYQLNPTTDVSGGSSIFVAEVYTP